MIIGNVASFFKLDKSNYMPKVISKLLSWLNSAEKDNLVSITENQQFNK
jgi:hypothetical protein